MIDGGIQELDEMARAVKLTSMTYGISKAFINTYTSLLARSEASNGLMILRSLEIREIDTRGSTSLRTA